MSTTRVPLLVTGAGALADDELPDGEPPDAEPPDADGADDPPTAAAVEELELLGVLVLLQAATLTTKDAARAPAVHLRMRI